MNIDTFFAHHGIGENPFSAEEARLDPVYGRLLDSAPAHPDFGKILGRIEQPSTSIVFGEKGSGKTAIRLMMAKQIDEHNRRNPEQRVLTVVYDDLNPVLDNLLRRSHHNAQTMLERLRIEDHQDAILSLAVTQLVSGLLGQTGPDAALMPNDLNKRIRKSMGRQNRVDLLVLAALYDQPDAGAVLPRWKKLKKTLRLGSTVPQNLVYYGAVLLTLLGILLASIAISPPALINPEHRPNMLLPGLSIAGAAILWSTWGWRHLRRLWLGHKIWKATPVVNHRVRELQAMLAQLSRSDLARQPFPLPGAGDRNERDSRYQLTRKLIELLRPLGYVGLVVLVDRLDEPTLVAGHADRMKAIVWPMFDNKFLQQDRVGFKMLLPIELRHILHRESSSFFQEARLDKQRMIDRLTWSGPTLHDLCIGRLRACCKSQKSTLELTDLFEPEVSRDLLIAALDQMNQPRDAFKFLYAVIQEHCRIVPQGDDRYKIARLTLDSVRRNQAQRVQEFHRGLTPA